MSRIYTDKPLTSLPSQNVTWPGDWTETDLPGGALDRLGPRGPGLILEGVVTKRFRRIVEDASGGKFKYLVLRVKHQAAFQRNYDPDSGRELEPNFGRTQMISTGYLTSSYTKKTKGVSQWMSEADVKGATSKVDVTTVEMTLISVDDGSVSFFLREDDVADMEIRDGALVRLRTKGDSPFVESIAVLDSLGETKMNFAGDREIADSWSERIAEAKGASAATSAEGEVGVAAESRTSLRDAGEGCDDDEWDD